jgi:hypothetical protein
MKWLLENKFLYDEKTFDHAASNGNLENMKWLLENKFPYDNTTIECALDRIVREYGRWNWTDVEKDGDKEEFIKYIGETGGFENLKWLLENKFPFSEYSKKILMKYIYP